jgi:hypothetical protein
MHFGGVRCIASGAVAQAVCGTVVSPQAEYSILPQIECSVRVALFVETICVFFILSVFIGLASSVFLSHHFSTSHQPPVSQQYFSLTTNQHQPPATRQPNEAIIFEQFSTSFSAKCTTTHFIWLWLRDSILKP